VIFRRLISMIAAIAAIAAAAIVCVIALSFALYAALRDPIGPAWAAAAVAGAFALVALILAFLLTRKAKPKPVKGDEQNLTSRLIELARERPLVAAGAMAAAVAVVIRNPRILTAVASAALASRKRPPAPKR
jgi:membrane protease YdiL (CAAX protease family)